MGITIAGGEPHLEPIDSVAVVISTRESWGDDWETAADLRLKSLRVESGSAGRGEAIIWRDYGMTLEPSDRTPFQHQERQPISIEKHWIKIEFVQNRSRVTEFVGRVAPTASLLGGTSVTGPAAQPVATGRQEWTVRGPRHYLEKMDVDRSWCLSYQPNEGNPNVTTLYEREVDRLFDMNSLEQNALLVGNRSDIEYDNGGQFDASHIFGGRQVWTNAQFLKYVLKRYATIIGGPSFDLTGSGLEILESLKHPIRLPDSISVAGIMNKLIRPDSGLDYFIKPKQDDSGFDIVVFTLYDEDITIPGVNDDDKPKTYKKNSNIVEFRTGETKGISVQIATTADHRYDTIRVIGAPIKVTRTLWADWFASDDSKPANGGTPFEERASLVQGWSSEIFDSGITSATGEETKREQFSAPLESIPGILLLPDPDFPSTFEESSGTVIAVDNAGFTWRGGRTDDGVSNMTWEAGAQEQQYLAGQAGARLSDARAHDAVRSSPILGDVYSTFVAPFNFPQDVPKLESTGAITVDTELGINKNRAYQNFYRSTLRKTQLRAGYDYSTDPATVRGLSNFEADFLPAAVYVFVPDEFQPETEPGEPYNPVGRWQLADELGFNVGVLSEDLGIRLSGIPSHILALNHWDTAAATKTAPKYDHRFLVATVSYEADARVMMEYGLENGENPDGTVKVIRVPTAELWYLAGRTVVGIDPATGDLQTSGENWRVLRYDIPDMALRLAGAIARYYDERNRATVTEQGLKSRSDLIGAIFRNVDNGGFLSEVHTPITQVVYDNTQGKPKTTISTGFAR